ncbi:hypothetical protein C1646_764688 [Rhizophagus diaphanus]|nr:hypothetical protein C1646_764688 [Rhizophagus diaphanus] [Rhizophagus sp. MUCL 43196]
MYLVNRLWCRLAIPLLWENPFSIPKQNYNFIGIYLHNLNDELKAKLKEYGINDNLFPSNTLFNYPIFLKHLYTQKIISSIEGWSKDVIRTSKIENNLNTFIKKLLIKNREIKGQDIHDSTLFQKNNIMKNKRVKYLTFIYYFKGSSTVNNDLFSFKDESQTNFPFYETHIGNYLDSNNYTNWSTSGLLQYLVEKENYTTEDATNIHNAFRCHLEKKSAGHNMFKYARNKAERLARTLDLAEVNI